MENFTFYERSYRRKEIYCFVKKRRMERDKRLSALPSKQPWKSEELNRAGEAAATIQIK